MNPILIGPFFSRQSQHGTESWPEIDPMGLSIEWASPTQTASIPLYRHHSPQARLRLEQIIVKARDIPFETSCPGHLVG